MEIFYGIKSKSHVKMDIFVPITKNIRNGKLTKFSEFIWIIDTSEKE